MTARVALVVTARDEARVLPANLAYHRWLGVERAYVYLDDPGDTTLASLEHTSGVAAGPCASPAAFHGMPGLERYVARWATHHTARQCLNTADAMIRARADGCEWLIALDADELVCLDRRQARPGALAETLARLPEAVSAVRLPNLEVVPGPRTRDVAFRDRRLFKLRGGPHRPIPDPRTGRAALSAWFFGHAAGKSIVRLGRNAVPRGVHSFSAPDGGPLPTLELGELLHYYAYDFDDWFRRSRLLRGQPTTHVMGHPVEPQKLLWIELAESLGEAALEEYFAGALTPGPEELARLMPRGWRRLFRHTWVVEVRSVADAFATEPPLRSF